MDHEPHNDTDHAIIDASETAVVTTDSGHGLELLLPGEKYRPDDQQMTGAQMYLAVMFMRSNDEAFVQEQIDWYNATKRHMS